MSKYLTDEIDFEETPPSVKKAAEGFVDLLCEYMTKINGHPPGDPPKITTYRHVTGQDDPKAVCIIYEMMSDPAERIQLGYPEVKKEFDALETIQDDHGVLFEMVNHWSTSVREN